MSAPTPEAPADSSSQDLSNARVLLVDGHSMAFRAFFALPVDNFATTSGQPTNAVFGFTSMLINLIRDEQPTHLLVAWDVSRATFRTDAYPEYKGTRSATPDEFKAQIPLIHEVLGALQVAHIGVADVEADDVLATMARRAVEGGAQVLICSGDRDTFQLVGERATVLYPRKGVSELARMTPADVEAKYGVAPQRYPDLAALVGESSDNLPGVPGVGPKTAAKWITAYGDLEGIVANAAAIKGKAGESLREHLAQVLLNRQINALLTDVDVPISLAQTERQPIDRAAVHEVFDALQFRVLRDRLFQIVAEDAVSEDADDLEVPTPNCPQAPWASGSNPVADRPSASRSPAATPRDRGMPGWSRWPTARASASPWTCPRWVRRTTPRSAVCSAMSRSPW